MPQGEGETSLISFFLSFVLVFTRAFQKAASFTCEPVSLPGIACFGNIAMQSRSNLCLHLIPLRKGFRLFISVSLLGYNEVKI